ncbi:MAG TPA: ABC transporter substrate-binding protein, partial [Spirochaetaceae bacterium]|nr:ABC transporter substrate-binding protein [Spirochaetaceae bacterium]
MELFDQEQYLGRRFDPIMGAFGVAGTWNMTAANFGLNAKKPEFFEALQFVKKLVDNKVIDPDWPSLKKDDFRAAWKQGK